MTLTNPPTILQGRFTMPGKMEEKIKEVLENRSHVQTKGFRKTVSPVIQAIYELARHIDKVEKQKEDDEFTSESDKEADLPAIGEASLSERIEKASSPPKEQWEIFQDSKKEADLPATKPKFFPPHSLNPS